jgi:cysteine dioxygenase
MSILNIKILIDKINDLRDFNNVGEILKDYIGVDWIEYMKINEARYNRIKVYSNDKFEIFIITWNVNQTSDIHDHSDNGCYVKILSGELIEGLYTKKFLLERENILKNKSVSFMHNDIGYHCIENKGDKVAVSIHIYSPPNHITKYYDRC